MEPKPSGFDVGTVAAQVFAWFASPTVAAFIRAQAWAYIREPVHDPSADDLRYACAVVEECYQQLHALVGANGSPMTRPKRDPGRDAASKYLADSNGAAIATALLSASPRECQQLRSSIQRVRIRATVQLGLRDRPPPAWLPTAFENVREELAKRNLAVSQSEPSRPLVNTSKTPGVRLLVALNNLRTVCAQSSLFRHLAERRAEASALHLENLNVLAQAASDRANERLRAGASFEEAVAEIARLSDDSSDLVSSNEPPEYRQTLAEMLGDARGQCRHGIDALRDGGANELDRSLAPNAAGQPRSVELHTMLQEAESLFAVLTMGLFDSRVVIDNEVAKMEQLAGSFSRACDEIHAVTDLPAPAARSGGAKPPSEDQPRTRRGVVQMLRRAANTDEHVLQLRRDGKSYREIAAILKAGGRPISKSEIQRIVKRNTEEVSPIQTVPRRGTAEENMAERERPGNRRTSREN